MRILIVFPVLIALGIAILLWCIACKFHAKRLYAFFSIIAFLASLMILSHVMKSADVHIDKNFIPSSDSTTAWEGH